MYDRFGNINLTVIHRLINVQHKIILDVSIFSYILEVDWQTHDRENY